MRRCFKKFTAFALFIFITMQSVMPFEVFAQSGGIVFDFDGDAEGELSGFVCRANIIPDAGVVIEESGNRAFKAGKKQTTNASDGYAQYTFKSGESINENFVFSFSAKQTVSGSKRLMLYNTSSNAFLTFAYGESGKVLINGEEISVDGNTNGKFSSYKFSFNVDNGTLDFFYNGEKKAEDLQISQSAEINRFRFSFGNASTEGGINTALIDNIEIYKSAEPRVSAPRFSKTAEGSVEITAEEGMKIYYSTDKSYPVISAESLYTAPINAENGTYIRAIAVNEQSGAASCCSYIGPLGEDNPDPDPEPEPEPQGKFYLLDFENKEAGAISNGGDGMFDANWGLISQKEIIDETANKAVRIVREPNSNPTAAYLQHTFTGEDIIDGAVGFEFSAKQTVSYAKSFRLYNSETAFLKFDFGTENTGSINGAAVSLNGNTDGEYHHYKFIISESGQIEFYYDGKRVVGSFSATSSVSVNKYWLFMNGNAATRNDVTLDNIMVYEAASPIPALPEITVGNDGKVSIKSDSNTKIYYTLNCEYPTITNENLYSEPLTVENGQYVRAIAVNGANTVSAAAWRGPFPIDPDPEPDPDEPSGEIITPVMGEKMYLMDFENEAVGAVPAGGGGLFDSDWGLINEREIINEGANKAIKISRTQSDLATAAYLKHTFPADKIISGALTFEFSARQTEDFSKNIRLYNEAGTAFLNFEFGKKNSGSVNGTSVTLENNLDGKYHHYRLTVSGDGIIKLYYDGAQQGGSFSAADTVEVKRYQLFVNGNQTVLNSVIIDNITLYEESDPIPQMPAFSIEAGTYPYNTEIALLAEEGAEIYYSTNGSYPILSENHKYTEPIKMNKADMYIRAVAVNENKNVSACAWSGAYIPKNENGIIRLTDVPFGAARPSETDSAAAEIYCLEGGRKITLVLALYKGEKLLNISMENYTLASGINNISCRVERNSAADKARLCIWSPLDEDFAPLTDEWVLTK